MIFLWILTARDHTTHFSRSMLPTTTMTCIGSMSGWGTCREPPKHQVQVEYHNSRWTLLSQRSVAATSFFQKYCWKSVKIVKNPASASSYYVPLQTPKCMALMDKLQPEGIWVLCHQSRVLIPGSCDANWSAIFQHLGKSKPRTTNTNLRTFIPLLRRSCLLLSCTTRHLLCKGSLQTWDPSTMVPVTVGQTRKQHFLQTMDKAHSKGHVNLLNIDPWEIKVFQSKTNGEGSEIISLFSKIQILLEYMHIDAYCTGDCDSASL